MSNNNIDENQAHYEVGLLTATDPDATGNDHLNWYYLSGHGFACTAHGADEGLFEINGINQIRVTGTALDYENPVDSDQDGHYEICIRATDDAGLFFDKNFTITVNGVNTTPTNISLDSTSVAENQPVGTVVGNLGNTDDGDMILE